MNQSKSLPAKYQVIGEQLIHRVLDSTFAIGDTLPTEKELCETFSVSRHTAREALRYVQRTGLVERRQGSGTKVVRSSMPEQINQFINSIEELMMFGNATRFKLAVSDMVPATADVARLLDCAAGDQCIHLGGVRVEPHDKKPVCYTNIFRLPRCDDIDAGLQHPKKAVKTLMKALNMKHIAKVEQTIEACLIPSSQAPLINAQTGTAAMLITRRYFSKRNQGLILVSQSIFPAHRFSYSTVLYNSE
ncbi:GntR family transcriptional regulator [Aestuariibacter sp. A3R04]|uniref:GntR family transcriptional regulator n=1 Tax=Aestuariibacter sp. A3R04 TaxID=2841571 RepID=UPI001C098B00|nr:GntR family transcriptional regulator [Aestuariibacter sp. A3R04]MBU3023526.1 GntR family transcriptional regulator [Aestuariibacter sp. A3R04]